MAQPRKYPALGLIAYIALTTVLGLYFAFASVQGNYGLLRRMEIQAERQRLQADLTVVKHEVAQMRNKTRRLSDRYLDLDLLDEQARDILGMMRSDEVIIR
ncbi:septum formation initiator family protein [Maribius pontilimi]|uniref:Septum formation initiator family protein n=1 Tax=Palleronia pontilimi TaxID=1964209 RepID=A0A934IFJ2_9RHOB|nr:septum formation initiator family protein [Palleronia pontilimi]MBJ3761938.1 septum formation initiator family protein [Palleronia pontilimi]